MKIVIVGGTGTIGSAVATALQGRHEVVRVGRTRGDYQTDIADSAAIGRTFDAIGGFDALVSAAGRVHYGDFAAVTEKEMAIGLQDKLMGQVNLVLLGRDYIADEGSFTLTSGVVGHDPVRDGACASLVNGALEYFVRAAAFELPRGLRINCVSPGLLVESAEALGDSFPGHEPVPGARVALAYVKSVLGHQTGQVYHVI